MTTREKHRPEGKKDRRLDVLVRKVESIDRNVEDILDRLNAHLDPVSYDLMWNGREYLNDKDY